MRLNKKIKLIIITFFVIFGLSVGVLYFFTSKSFLTWLGQRKIEKRNQEIAEMFRQDTYGGKTPYETFDMFLAAMEKGDIELALKYFNRPDKYIDEFSEMKKNGTLAAQVEEWKEARKTFEEVRDDYNDWVDHATIQYSYNVDKQIKGIDIFGFEYTIEPGIHYADIVFDINEYSKVWKITLF